MEVARGVGEEAIRAVLEQHTTEQERSEPTEVRWQLWFVNHWSGGHNYAHNYSSNKRGPPIDAHIHTL